MSEWDAATLETIIGEALKARDFKAVVAAVRILATVDPARAEAMLDALQLGIAVAMARAIE